MESLPEERCANNENCSVENEENLPNDFCKKQKEVSMDWTTTRPHSSNTNIKNIPDNSLFSCDYCFFETNRKEVFIFHQKKHITVRNYKCDHCNFRTDYIQCLKQHNCCKLTCSKCDFVAKSKVELNNHLSIHLLAPKVDPQADNASNTKDIKLLVCKVCSFRTRSQGIMKLHGFAHVGKIFSCKKCEYTTNIKKVLDAHEANHIQRTQKNEAMYKCPECPYSSGRRITLERHMMIHDKCSVLECTICNYKSTSLDELEYHITLHHIRQPKTKEKLYHKQQPKIKANHQHTRQPKIEANHHKRQLKIKANHHHKQLKFEENVMNKGKKQGKPSDLQSSLYPFKTRTVSEYSPEENAHKKVYNCPICPFGCNFEPEFEKHLRSHNSTDSRIQKYLRSKKYKCEYCKYKTNDDGVLENHIVNVHKQELLDEGRSTLQVGAATITITRPTG